MIWSLDLDDFSGRFCNSGRYPLLSQIDSQFKTFQSTRKSTVSEPAAGRLVGAWRALVSGTDSGFETGFRPGSQSVAGSMLLTRDGGLTVTSGGKDVHSVDIGTDMKTVLSREGLRTDLAPSGGMLLETGSADISMQRGTQRGGQSIGEMGISGSAIRKDINIKAVDSTGVIQGVGQRNIRTGMQTDSQDGILGSGPTLPSQDVHLTAEGGIQTEIGRGFAGVSGTDFKAGMMGDGQAVKGSKRQVTIGIDGQDRGGIDVGGSRVSGTSLVFEQGANFDRVGDQQAISERTLSATATTGKDVLGMREGTDMRPGSSGLTSDGLRIQTGDASFEFQGAGTGVDFSTGGVLSAGETIQTDMKKSGEAGISGVHMDVSAPSGVMPGVGQGDFQAGLQTHTERRDFIGDFAMSGQDGPSTGGLQSRPGMGTGFQGVSTTDFQTDSSQNGGFVGDFTITGQDVPSIGGLQSGPGMETGFQGASTTSLQAGTSGDGQTTGFEAGVTGDGLISKDSKTLVGIGMGGKHRERADIQGSSVSGGGFGFERAAISQGGDQLLGLRASQEGPFPARVINNNQGQGVGTGLNIGASREAFHVQITPTGELGMETGPVGINFQEPASGMDVTGQGGEQLLGQRTSQKGTFSAGVIKTDVQGVGGGTHLQTGTSREAFNALLTPTEEQWMETRSAGTNILGPASGIDVTGSEGNQLLGQRASQEGTFSVGEIRTDIQGIGGGSGLQTEASREAFQSQLTPIGELRMETGLTGVDSQRPALGTDMSGPRDMTSGGAAIREDMHTVVLGETSGTRKDGLGDFQAGIATDMTSGGRGPAGDVKVSAQSTSIANFQANIVGDGTGTGAVDSGIDLSATQPDVQTRRDTGMNGGVIRKEMHTVVLDQPATITKVGQRDFQASMVNNLRDTGFLGDFKVSGGESSGATFQTGIIGDSQTGLIGDTGTGTSFGFERGVISHSDGRVGGLQDGHEGTLGGGRVLQLGSSGKNIRQIDSHLDLSGQGDIKTGMITGSKTGMTGAAVKHEVNMFAANQPSDVTLGGQGDFQAGMRTGTKSGTFIGTAGFGIQETRSGVDITGTGAQGPNLLSTGEFGVSGADIRKEGDQTGVVSGFQTGMTGDSGVIGDFTISGREVSGTDRPSSMTGDIQLGISRGKVPGSSFGFERVVISDTGDQFGGQRQSQEKALSAEVMDKNIQGIHEGTGLQTGTSSVAFQAAGEQHVGAGVLETGSSVDVTVKGDASTIIKTGGEAGTTGAAARKEMHAFAVDQPGSINTVGQAGMMTGMRARGFASDFTASGKDVSGTDLTGDGIGIIDIASGVESSATGDVRGDVQSSGLNELKVAGLRKVMHRVVTDQHGVEKKTGQGNALAALTTDAGADVVAGGFQVSGQGGFATNIQTDMTRNVTGISGTSSGMEFSAKGDIRGDKTSGETGMSGTVLRKEMQTFGIDQPGNMISDMSGGAFASDFQIQGQGISGTEFKTGLTGDVISIGGTGSGVDLSATGGIKGDTWTGGETGISGTAIRTEKQTFAADQTGIMNKIGQGDSQTNVVSETRGADFAGDFRISGKEDSGTGLQADMIAVQQSGTSADAAPGSTFGFERVVMSHSDTQLGGLGPNQEGAMRKDIQGVGEGTGLQTGTSRVAFQTRLTPTGDIRTETGMVGFGIQDSAGFGVQESASFVDLAGPKDFHAPGMIASSVRKEMHAVETDQPGVIKNVGQHDPQASMAMDTRGSSFTGDIKIPGQGVSGMETGLTGDIFGLTGTGGMDRTRADIGVDIPTSGETGLEGSAIRKDARTAAADQTGTPKKIAGNDLQPGIAMDIGSGGFAGEFRLSGRDVSSTELQAGMPDGRQTGITTDLSPRRDFGFGQVVMSHGGNQLGGQMISKEGTLSAAVVRKGTELQADMATDTSGGGFINQVVGVGTGVHRGTSGEALQTHLAPTGKMMIDTGSARMGTGVDFTGPIDIRNEIKANTEPVMTGSATKEEMHKVVINQPGTLRNVGQGVFQAGMTTGTRSSGFAGTDTSRESSGADFGAPGDIRHMTDAKVQSDATSIFTVSQPVDLAAQTQTFDFGLNTGPQQQDFTGAARMLRVVQPSSSVAGSFEFSQGSQSGVASNLLSDAQASSGIFTDTGTKSKATILRESSTRIDDQPIVRTNVQTNLQPQLAFDIHGGRRSTGTVFSQGTKTVSSQKTRIGDNIIHHKPIVSPLFSWSGTAPEIIDEHAEGNLLLDTLSSRPSGQNTKLGIKTDSMFKDFTVQTHEIGSQAEPLTGSLKNQMNIIDSQFHSDTPTIGTDLAGHNAVKTGVDLQSRSLKISRFPDDAINRQTGTIAGMEFHSGRQIGVDKGLAADMKSGGMQVSAVGTDSPSAPSVVSGRFKGQTSASANVLKMSGTKKTSSGTQQQGAGIVGITFESQPRFGSAGEMQVIKPHGTFGQGIKGVITGNSETEQTGAGVIGTVFDSQPGLSSSGFQTGQTQIIKSQGTVGKESSGTQQTGAGFSGIIFDSQPSSSGFQTGGIKPQGTVGRGISDMIAKESSNTKPSGAGVDGITFSTQPLFDSSGFQTGQIQVLKSQGTFSGGMNDVKPNVMATDLKTDSSLGPQAGNTGTQGKFASTVFTWKSKSPNMNSGTDSKQLMSALNKQMAKMTSDLLAKQRQNIGSATQVEFKTLSGSNGGPVIHTLNVPSSDGAPIIPASASDLNVMKSGRVQLEGRSFTLINPQVSGEFHVQGRTGSAVQGRDSAVQVGQSGTHASKEIVDKSSFLTGGNSASDMTLALVGTKSGSAHSLPGVHRTGQSEMHTFAEGVDHSSLSTGDGSAADVKVTFAGGERHFGGQLTGGGPVIQTGQSIKHKSGLVAGHTSLAGDKNANFVLSSSGQSGGLAEEIGTGPSSLMRQSRMHQSVKAIDHSNLLTRGGSAGDMKVTVVGTEAESADGQPGGPLHIIGTELTQMVQNGIHRTGQLVDHSNLLTGGSSVADMKFTMVGKGTETADVQPDGQLRVFGTGPATHIGPSGIHRTGQVVGLSSFQPGGGETGDMKITVVGTGAGSQDGQPGRQMTGGASGQQHFFRSSMVSQGSSGTWNNPVLDPIVILQPFSQSARGNNQVEGFDDRGNAATQNFLSMNMREFIGNPNLNRVRISGQQRENLKTNSISTQRIKTTKPVKASGTMSSNLIDGSLSVSGRVATKETSINNLAGTRQTNALSSKSVPGSANCKPGSLLCFNHINKVIVRANGGNNKVADKAGASNFRPLTNV